MEKIKSLIIAALAIVILGAFFISTAFASDSTGFSLALSSNQIQYKIPAGTMFNGTVATSGWVRVWVTEPSGGEIVNLGIIEKTTSFGFIAQQNGTYTFNFENDLPNTITVTFTYTSNPQLPDTNAGIPLTYIIFVGTVAVVGSLLIFFGIRRKTKKVMAAYKKAESAKSNTAS
ncbi:MAG: hypothetical protein ACLQO7_10340 [Candidatus Bathyarchaeia archaeon]